VLEYVGSWEKVSVRGVHFKCMRDTLSLISQECKELKM